MSGYFLPMVNMLPVELKVVLSLLVAPNAGAKLLADAPKLNDGAGGLLVVELPKLNEGFVCALLASNLKTGALC